MFQNVTGSTQNVTGVLQNVTTIPENTPENTPENINTTTAAAVENVVEKSFDLETETPSQTDDLKENSFIGNQAITFAEENFPDKLSPFEKNRIREWCLEFQIHGSMEPDKIVISGLERCIMMKNCTLSYLEPIILDYIQNNVTTVKQIDELKNQFRKGKERKRGPEIKNANTSKPINSDKYESFYIT
ncbi:DnaD domain protein [Desulfitobacterium sp. AusDCA]|uniref:DnaD domain protein n=1 Tax=Desulfitobacterium sp. AusDCA TaxID=3240383 RepID=UPI003DA74C5E